MSFFISSSQSLSSITSLSGGGFVITWSSSDQDGDYSGIYAQRYDANGDALGEVSLILIPNEVVGTIDADILNGTAGIDEISTGSGADVAYAQADNDTITLTVDSTWELAIMLKILVTKTHMVITRRLA